MATILGRISPISQGVGSVSTAWVSAQTAAEFQALILLGVLGTAATVDAKIEQATTSGGAGVKDVTGKAIVQYVKATDDSKEAVINFRSADLDVSNNFAFVRLTLTVAAAASLVSGLLLGLNRETRYQPATALATTAQVVGGDFV